MTVLVGEARHGGGGAEGGPGGTRSRQFTLTGRRVAGADLSLRRPGGQVGRVLDLVAGVAASAGVGATLPPRLVDGSPGEGSAPLRITAAHRWDRWPRRAWLTLAAVAAALEGWGWADGTRRRRQRANSEATSAVRPSSVGGDLDI